MPDYRDPWVDQWTQIAMKEEILKIVNNEGFSKPKVKIIDKINENSGAFVFLWENGMILITTKCQITFKINKMVDDGYGNKEKKVITYDLDSTNNLFKIHKDDLKLLKEIKGQK